MSQNVNSSTSPGLNTCGCCAGSPPDATISNRPGLPALSYRIGTYSTFLNRMLARLPAQTNPGAPSNPPPLAALTTRAPDDPAIALLDAWAIVGDVLTFYQERIANEGYLRTATERRSALELARTIGYELRPGIAASVFLAFTVESAPGAPGVATVPAGTRIQSIPSQGQLPQTFETSQAIVAKKDWNSLPPRLSQPQTLDVHADSLYLAGLTTNLKIGDVLLLAGRVSGSLQTRIASIKMVTVQADQQRTQVDLVDNPPPPPHYVSAVLKIGEIDKIGITLNQTELKSRVLDQSWSERDLSAFFAIQRWNPAEVLQASATAPQPTLPPADEGVFVFRARAGFFGNNAPLHASLNRTDGTNPYPDWDANGGTKIWTDSGGNSYTDAHVHLERALPSVLPNTWAVFQSPTTAATVYRIGAVIEDSLADFGMSGRTSGLSLTQPDGTTPPDATQDLRTRSTTAFVQSERLELADLPIVDPIVAGSTSIPLGQLVLGLSPGQPLLVQGVRIDLPGVTTSEVVFVTDSIHAGGFTTISFSGSGPVNQPGLQYGYVRDTVTVSANVVLATNGETVNEVLGSGDGSQGEQSFTLRRPPLTYLSSSTASGAQSTLSVRIGEVQWTEVSRLYGQDQKSEVYLVRMSDDGKFSVIFGDGQQGARLPTGSENVVATYRSGSGLKGMVDAGSLSLLQTRPLGIRGVTNPLPATGAADPEDRESARTNAPLTVLTLDRIVSLSDFEDFARGFAGIGKAQAMALWTGASFLVNITVAGVTGEPVDAGSILYTNLVDAIQQACDPVQRFQVDSYQPLYFNLSARVLVDKPRYAVADVLTAVQSALLNTFAFTQRAIAQPVSAAEVETAIQAVPGVIATDLYGLYRVDDASGLSQTVPTPVLFARRALIANQQIQPAELLTVNPAGVTVTEWTP
ncbi:MAG TPA: putative baseplate assembly protein [Chloroflexota bacterium]|nr:putative baseplate assembly protein [Chloroflexota bacterium]